MRNALIFEYSPWFVILCIILALGYAFLLYFRDKKLKELSKTKISLLAVLRFFSSLIIALLLLSPLLKTIRTTVEKPIIIFAVDNSQSVKLACTNKDDRFQQMLDNVNNVINSVSDDYDVKSFSFGDDLTDTLPFDFSYNQTDISNVITQVSNQFYNKNIGALIIVSDGIYNKGSNPNFNLDNIIFPVYTVGVGDTTIYKDILIKDVQFNDIAFLKNRFPVEVTISAKKMKGQNASCSIYHKGKLIDTKNISITTDNYLEKLSFNIDAEEAGVQQYVISVTKFSEERNTTNNTKVIAVNVIENRQKILILANSPHPDAGAVLNSLKTNPNFDIDVFPIDKFNQKISDYSLIILDQLPSVTYKLQAVFSEITKAQIPVLFILGTQTDYETLNSFNIGVNVAQYNNAFDDANAFINPNFVDFEISDDFANLLKTAPPLIVPYGSFSLSPQTKSLILQKVKGIKTDKPLFVYSNSNPVTNASVGVILGENIWRLRMQCFKKYNDFEAFDVFFNQMIQALVLKINKSRFIVKVEKIIPENQDIIFKAEVYDKIYQLTNSGNVTLKISDSASNSFNYTFRKSQNSYNLNIGSLSAGKYSYVAQTEEGGEVLTNAGTFVVINSNVEALNLVANHKLLYQIANKTGGKFLYPSNLDSLSYYIDNNSNIVSISYEKQDLNDFIKYKWIFFLILSLLSVEWFLRKFFGSY